MPLEESSAKATKVHQNAPAPMSLDPLREERILSITDAFRMPTINQVRIEQRVVVRIAPRSPRRSEVLMNANSETKPRYREQKMASCMPVKSIAGVHQDGERLIFFMRDRGLVSARLEKRCRARDFYSGFYVERNKDGRLCKKRDILLSRAGTRCELRDLRRLVAVRD